jgi:AAA15 family ATPase/GTPase
MIKYIKIKNFKSIREAETKLPFFGAIVGSNAAGKTNFVQTIEFTKDLVMGATTEEAQNKISFSPFELFNMNSGSRQAFIEMVIADAQEKQFRLTYIIGLELKEGDLPTLVVESELLEKANDMNGYEIIYNRENKNTLKNANNESVPLAIDPKQLVLSQYKDPLVVHIRQIFSKINILQEKSYESRDSLVKSSAAGIAALAVRLKYKNIKAYEQFETIIRKILPSFSTYLIRSLKDGEDHKPDLSDKDEYFLVLLEEKNLKGKLSMKSVSKGDLYTLSFIGNALSMEGGTCLIIEEIENGMHPLRVKTVMDFLDNVSNQKNVQMLFTTHSPAIINKLRPSEVLYVKKDADQGTMLCLLEESKDIHAIEKMLSGGGEMTDFINSRL